MGRNVGFRQWVRVSGHRGRGCACFWEVPCFGVGVSWQGWNLAQSAKSRPQGAQGPCIPLHLAGPVHGPKVAVAWRPSQALMRTCCPPPKGPPWVLGSGHW